MLEFTGQYEPMEMIRRAVTNAKPRKGYPCARWVAVCETLAYGSTTSRELCRHFGLDPDEIINRKTAKAKRGGLA